MQRDAAELDSRHPVPNPWQRIGQRNPYLHNIFALFGIDPDAGEQEFERQCKRARLQLEAGQSLAVHGRQVSRNDVARATDLAKNPDGFIAERLLAHTVHRIDLKQFAATMAAIERIEFPRPEQLLPLPIRNLTFLTSLIPAWDELPAEQPVPLDDAMLSELRLPDRRMEEVYDN